MRGRPASGPRTLWSASVLLVLLLVLTSWIELHSVERANRMFRHGRFSDAARLLRSRIEDSDDRALLRYDLGTTLLRLGDAREGEEQLARALGAEEDSTVAFRTRYNLGWSMLVGALSHPDVDSAEVLARRAVDLNRDAMRLAPGSDDARWNLALSQRALDSLLWLKSGVKEEEVRDSLQNPDPDQALPALLRALQDQAGTPGGRFFSQGESEALARSLADAPLSAAEASSFLAGMSQQPGTILRRLFLVESENRWGNVSLARRRAW